MKVVGSNLGWIRRELLILNKKELLIQIQIQLLYCSWRPGIWLICSTFSHGEPVTYIVGSRGASQLGGSLLRIPLGYKANKHEVS